jgi:acetyltransferase-like isoleucine patch superfamily enzyme
MIELGKDVTIEPNVILNVKEGFIGDRSIVRSGARIEGTYVHLGTESYLDHGAWIGGGSCFDKGAYLKAGCWLHMGWNSQINIARGVDIGDEVGIGIETKILTHGAYLPIDEGFPAQWGGVKMGDRVWLPHAWVNPGVTIGSNVVVGAMSLVNIDLPDHCFATGVPVRVLDYVRYPRNTEIDFAKILSPLNLNGVKFSGDSIILDETLFWIKERIIEGIVTQESELIKNQLRRNGIRFKFYVKDGYYVRW